MFGILPGLLGSRRNNANAAPWNTTETQAFDAPAPPRPQMPAPMMPSRPQASGNSIGPPNVYAPNVFAPNVSAMPMPAMPTLPAPANSRPRIPGLPDFIPDDAPYLVRRGYEQMGVPYRNGNASAAPARTGQGIIPNY